MNIKSNRNFSSNVLTSLKIQKLASYLTISLVS